MKLGNKKQSRDRLLYFLLFHSGPSLSIEKGVVIKKQQAEDKTKDKPKKTATGSSRALNPLRSVLFCFGLTQYRWCWCHGFQECWQPTSPQFKPVSGCLLASSEIEYLQTQRYRMCSKHDDHSKTQTRCYHGEEHGNIQALWLYSAFSHKANQVTQKKSRFSIIKC